MAGQSLEGQWSNKPEGICRYYNVDVAPLLGELARQFRRFVSGD
jgi:hypothetical protein